MSALQTRLERLEAVLLPPTSNEQLFILLRLVATDRDRQPVRGVADGRTFHRQLDETVMDFEARIELATRPAVPSLNGRVAVLYND